MALKEDIRTITISSKCYSKSLDSEELLFLEEYLSEFNHIKFITSNYIKKGNHQGKKIGQIKSECDKENRLPHRVFNAGLYQAIHSQINSQMSNKKNDLENTLDKIKEIEKKIKKQAGKINLINAIKNVKVRYSPYNESEKAKAIKKKTTFHNQKQRLQNHADELQYEIEKGIFSFCYGSAKLLKQRNKIHKNDVNNIHAWKKEWREKRFGEMLFVGSTDETLGNSNANIDYVLEEGKIAYYLKITVPTSFRKKYGFSHIRFPIKVNYYQKELQDHIDYHKTVKQKGSGITSSLSVRLIKDRKGDFDLKIGLSSSLHMKPVLKTVEQFGVIGVDINPDHLDIAETDGNGNFLYGFTIKLDLNNKSTDQRKTILSEAVKHIIDYAESKGKSIVLENLDFSKKKKDLARNFNKQYARMLSAFSYGKIKEFFISKCWKAGVNLLYVNPAYTSFIGNIKYRCKTSIKQKHQVALENHVSAAFVIARRGMNFKEKIPQKINIASLDEETLTIEQKPLGKMVFDYAKPDGFRKLASIRKVVFSRKKGVLMGLKLSEMSKHLQEKLRVLNDLPLGQKLYFSTRLIDG